MGTIDARGACHDSGGRYATASTCAGGLSEESAIALAALGGAALVGLVVWLAARPSRDPAPGGVMSSPPEHALSPDRNRLGPRAEAEEEARAMGRLPLRRCVDSNGNPVVIRGLCSARGMRDAPEP
jgi:hypothetical protein